MSSAAAILQAAGPGSDVWRVVMTLMQVPYPQRDLNLRDTPALRETIVASAAGSRATLGDLPAGS